MEGFEGAISTGDRENGVEEYLMKEEGEEEDSGSLAPLFRNNYHNIQERRDKASVSLNNKKKKWGGGIKVNRTAGGSLPPGVGGYYTLAKVIKY